MPIDYTPPDGDDYLALVEVVDSLADLVAQVLQEDHRFNKTTQSIAQRARNLYIKSIGEEEEENDIGD